MDIATQANDTNADGKEPLVPRPTGDTGRDYRVAWLRIEVARHEARLALSRAVLIAEQLQPDLGGDHLDLFNEYDAQLSANSAAEQQAMRAKLKYLIPDQADLIDAAFDETDEDDTSEATKDLSMFPPLVLNWILNALDNWACLANRNLEPQAMINEILENLRTLSMTFYEVTPALALSLKQHYLRVWERKQASS